MSVWGRIVLAKGRPKREIRDAVVGANATVFNGQHLYLRIVLVQLCGTVLVPFSRIYTVSYRFHSFASPELVRACMLCIVSGCR